MRGGRHALVTIGLQSFTSNLSSRLRKPLSMTQQDAAPGTVTAPLTVDAIMARSGVQFGTSGARGQVVAMTDQVCHAYTTGFLQHLADLGEFAPGTRVAIAGDLRPSTPRIMVACAQAVRDLGASRSIAASCRPPLWRSMPLVRAFPH
jgi:hypothetical protein